VRGLSYDTRSCCHKAEAVKAGLPDICLPVPRGIWHGLYLELKKQEGSVSRAQRRWLDALSTVGCRARRRAGVE
jgi:hypothetical protein